MYLGIEIGGTKLQLGVGAGDGSNFVAFERRDIVASNGATGILEQIRAVGRELVARHGVSRVGFGFGGPVDYQRGVVRTSHQVAGWEGFPLGDWCHEHLGVPAVVGNDCDAAAVAEAHFGAGRGARTVFYVTVGTGVGGGLVIEGRLQGTDRPACAEIGHLRPGLDATDSHDTVESRASGRGLETAARALLAGSGVSRPDRDDLLARCGNDLEKLTGRMLAEAAAAGNATARSVIADGARALGWAIAQVSTIVAPAVVIVGGGVSLMDESLFLEPVRREFGRYIFPPLKDAVRIEPAALGEAVVVHGALALARQNDQAGV